MPKQNKIYGLSTLPIIKFITFALLYKLEIETFLDKKSTEKATIKSTLNSGVVAATVFKHKTRPPSFVSTVFFL